MKPNTLLLIVAMDFFKIQFTVLDVKTVCLENRDNLLLSGLPTFLVVSYQGIRKAL